MPIWFSHSWVARSYIHFDSSHFEILGFILCRIKAILVIQAEYSVCRNKVKTESDSHDMFHNEKVLLHFSPINRNSKGFLLQLHFKRYISSKLADIVHIFLVRNLLPFKLFRHGNLWWCIEIWQTPFNNIVGCNLLINSS